MVCSCELTGQMQDKDELMCGGEATQKQITDGTDTHKFGDMPAQKTTMHCVLYSMHASKSQQSAHKTMPIPGLLWSI